MRLSTLLVVVGCIALIGCREQSANQAPDSTLTVPGDGEPSDGGGYSGDGARAGRKDRPQRPELEE
ncbi:MAG TPA: hypothetical protein QF564_14835 [Pirellulaceae bacterium]|nr:hypothetical protein [Pirellulaceae bacterium]